MTEPRKYRRKTPVVHEAMQWDGTNGSAIELWSDGAVRCRGLRALMYMRYYNVWAEIGDWIIRDRGGFHPCKPDMFAELYEEVPDA